MNNSEVFSPAEALRQWVIEQHGFYGKPLRKEVFLREVWASFNSITRFNQKNSFIQNAGFEYPDFVPRAYLVFSILYGSYGYEPDTAHILNDFIYALDKDLEERELRVCEYARMQGDNTFFPELYRRWMDIRKIYGAKEFDLELLPPTPYIAYALLTLNKPKLVTRENVGLPTLFEELTIMRHKMQRLVASGLQHPTA